MTLIGITLGLVVLIFLVWSFYPYQTIEFHSEYITNKSHYVQGETGFYLVDYCKYTDVTPIVHRTFVDDLIFEATNVKAVLKPGCYTDAKVPITIPEALPPGKYHLHVEIDYPMNYIRDINKNNNSNWFTVTENFNNLKE